MIYQIFVFLIIWLIIKGPKIPKIPFKITALTIIAFIISFLPFMASELKFKFQGTKALLSFFGAQSHFGGSFTEMLLKYLDRFNAIFFLNIWGINLFLAGLTGIVTIYLSLKLTKKTKTKKQLIFLVSWVISPILLHFFGGTSGTFINLGAGIGAIILTSWLIDKLFNKKNWKLFYLLAILLIIVGNANNILSQNKRGEVLFSVQDKVVLGDEVKAIDWIYQQSDNQPFRLNTITNPLFINTTWAYLFDWHGKKEYGYMPIWWGETQVNVFGDQIEFAKKEKTNFHFLIIEPGPGIPEEYIKAIRQLENSRSKVVETKQIGNFLVEKRQITRSRIFTSRDVFYQINPATN